MVESSNQRPHRAYDPHEQVRDSGQAQHDPGNDPLAELARLIGQSDPFADFERKAGADARHGLEAAPPAHPQAWPPESAGPPQMPHPAAYPSAASPDSYAAVAAELQGGVPHAYAEQYPEGTYTPYPEQTAPDPSQAGYGYPPEEAYHQGYDPYYADGEALDEADFQAHQEQQRGRRRLAAVIAILALAVFGGAAAYGYRSFVASGVHASPPPVIKADTTPAKVMPARQAGDSASNKLIYDRVGERNQAAERVVPREERPVDIKTVAVAPGPRAAYPGPGENATTAPPPTVPVTGRNTNSQVLPVASAPSIGQGSGAILPSAKKVRTVTIRPDMTVVPSSAAGSPEPAQQPASVQPSEPEPAQAAPPHSVASVPAAPAPGRSPPPPRRQSSSVPLSLSPDAAPPAPAPRAPARSAQQPLALASVPAAGSDGARTATAPSGNFAVQVSSQRSEAEANAAYRTLQSRYPNVLSGRSSFVRRADLGSRGVYYRTMVGPFATGEQAAQLCSSLKAAGGQCIIHRN